jgi:hypothetical protein
MPTPLYDRLKAAADERNVGMNWLMVKLLQEGADRLIPVDELRLTTPPRSQPGLTHTPVIERAES